MASVKDEYRAIAKAYIDKFEFYHCFETPNLHWLERRINEYEQKICFMAEYFLPDMEKLQRLSSEYEIRVLTQENFVDLYLPEWSNALCEERRELDIFGIGHMKRADWLVLRAVVHGPIYGQPKMQSKVVFLRHGWR